MHMKKSIKLISIFCVVLVVISLFPAEIFASEDKFVKIKVTSIDDSGNKNINEELFYCKNNELYISNYTIVKYTMYDYDEENTAFVRIGQTYKNSTSKIKINESDNTVDVWSLIYHETQDCDIYKFNEYYFLPLAQIASYLKANVTYVDDNCICITSSGYSIADAMYNFNKDVKFMDDIKIIDDLFYGNESAYKRYCVLGYMGETIFNFKLSNIVGLGSYETYCDIMKNAVNNNDVYNELMMNDNLLIDVLDFSQDTYENIYKKVSKVPKLSSSAITTMFVEYKENNSFGDSDTLFDNFFESEELEIAPIKEFGDTISVVSDYLEMANYLCDYFRMNEDNRSALEYVSSVKSKSNEISSIKYIGSLYNDNFVKSATTKLTSKLNEELISKTVKEIGLSKVKLATSITNEVFKLFGFDLSNNSSYDIMLANDLKRVILNNCEEYETEKLLKPSNSENLRLAMIMTLLVEIEAYEMANKVAKKTGLSGYYNDDIDYLNKRLALFYKAKESQYYDDFESMKKVHEDNQQQLQKIDLEKLDTISQDEALRINDPYFLLQSSIWRLDDSDSSGWYFTSDGEVWSVNLKAMTVINWSSLYKEADDGRIIIRDFGGGENTNYYLSYNRNGYFSVEYYDLISERFSDKKGQLTKYVPTVNKDNVNQIITGLLNTYQNCLNGYMGIALNDKLGNSVYFFDDSIDQKGKLFKHVDCSKNYIKTVLSFVLSDELYNRYYKDENIIEKQVDNYTSTYLHIEQCKYDNVSFFIGDNLDSDIELISIDSEKCVVKATAYYGWEAYAQEDYTFIIQNIDNLLKITNVEKSNYYTN